ncbi:hypothetical protein CRUP_019523 [Coryphaenoides rupestris]|nr:hypothetical protein CRUP_019523 [Coryphaenoides rupestris]
MAAVTGTRCSAISRHVLTRCSAISVLLSPSIPTLHPTPIHPATIYSQCSCRSWVSRKSEGIPRGLRPPGGPGGALRSSHSMLSKPVSDRPGSDRPGSDRPVWSEAGEELQKDSSSIRPRVRGSDTGVVPPRVLSRKASSWGSEVREDKPGSDSEPR